MFLEISQNSQVSGCNFIKKETLAQVFSCEFCETLRTPFLQITPGWLLLILFGHHIPFRGSRLKVFYKKHSGKSRKIYKKRPVSESPFQQSCKPATLLKMGTPADVFSCEFWTPFSTSCDCFQNTSIDYFCLLYKQNTWICGQIIVQST